MITVVLSNDVMAIDLRSRHVVLVKEVSELVCIDLTVAIGINEAECLHGLEIRVERQVLASKFDLKGVLS